MPRRPLKNLLNVKTRAIVALSIAVWLLSVPVSSDAARPGTTRLEVTGHKVQPLKWVRKTLGRAPRIARAKTAAEARELRERWARKAAERLRAAYVDLGFLYARVWYAVGPPTSDTDSDSAKDAVPTGAGTGAKTRKKQPRARAGLIRVEIDEGEMAGVELVGSTDIVSHVMFPLDMSLPQGVFQVRVVREALGRIRVLHRLGPLSYRVLPTGWRENTLGQRVRNRTLQVTVTRRGLSDGLEEAGGGFGFKIRADLQWGATALATLGYRGLLLDGDRFAGRIEVGIPLRRMLFEEDPKLRWVYGRLRLRYDFPEIVDSNLHPSISSSTALPVVERASLGLSRALALQHRSTVGLVWRPMEEFHLAFSIGVNYLKHMRVDYVPDWDGAVAQTTQGLLRGELAVSIGVVDREYRRRDLRSRWYLTTRLLSDGELWTSRTSMSGQLTLEFGQIRARHYLIFQTRAWTQHGDVRFWDERPLSGGVHRVYTEPFVWARHAAQLEISWRFPVIGEELQLGLFHAASIFEDRSAAPLSPGPVAAANAFGPSVHALLFNFLAINFYYGFGLSTHGPFTHSMTFSLSKVF